MRVIIVRIDEPFIRQWHIDLLDRLSLTPSSIVRLDHVPAADGRRSNQLQVFLRLERWLYGIEEGPLRRAREEEYSSYLDGTSPLPNEDVIIDLTSSPVPSPKTLTVAYDGTSGTNALVVALRAHRMPVISITDATGRIIASGRPGSEQPGLLAAALADVTVGLTSLVVGAVSGASFAEPVPEDPAPTKRTESYPILGLRRLWEAARYKIYQMLYRAPHWRVGWRIVEGDALTITDDITAHWSDLPDDGHHFYADPFPFEHEGRRYIFVEDYDHRLAKGVISVVEMNAGGPMGEPRPVLTHEVHLSYPFVLEHDDTIWMIPETSGARTVELYRAVDFPDAWELDRVLLEDIEASDVTTFVHEGRWWMMATVRDGGSFSDSLYLWSAVDLRGPWIPHVQNPVLIDIASARPGGRVVFRDGRLIRPAQDGRRGYGAAMTILEITRLDDTTFEQRLLKKLEPSPQWLGRRLHTLNEASGIETIDGSRMSPRFRPFGRHS